MIKVNQDYFLIADKKGAAWDFSCKIYEYIKNREEIAFAQRRSEFIDGVCKDDYNNPRDRGLVERMVDQSKKQFGGSVYLIELDITNFRDGEHTPHVTQNIRGGRCYYIHDSNLNPDRWLTQLQTTIDAMRSSSHNINIILPYTKFSRQDRRDRARTSVTTRVMAQCTDLTGSKLLTLDVHNKSTEAIYRETTFEALHSYPTVTEYLSRLHPDLLGNLVIVSPDVGGADRAQAFANWFGVEEVVVGVKVRVSHDNVKSLRFPTNVDFTGKNVLIVDDILDSGGTMKKASDEARKLGASSVNVYATHGLFTEGYDILKSFDRMFISNSILQPYQNGPELPTIAKEKLEVIPFEDLFGEGIYRFHNNMSISALFRKKKTK